MSTEEWSDRELVSRCRAGDEAAWGELVEHYSRYVYAIAAQGFRLSERDAEDVFQETFSRAFQRLGTLRDDGAFRPWLAQLTRRLCLDSIRARRDESDVTDYAGEGQDDLDRIDEALTVREALGSLSEDCREILDRFFSRDETYRTIGQALDLPPGTIASRISRCLARLREQLEGRKSPAAES